MPKLLHLSAQESRVFIVEMNAPKINQRQCNVEGCEAVVMARGLCRKHYKQGWPYPSISPDERFIRRIKKSKPNECWLWLGSKHAFGYGQVNYKGKNTVAHRVSAALFNGFDLNSPLLIRHTCDNPPCVNPAHLVPGTDVDNIRDAVQRDRISFGERHPRAKLTNADVVRIRKMKASGRSNAEIARLFGVSRTTIRSIAEGRLWRRVKDNSADHF